MSVMSAIILQEDLPYANSLKDMLDKTSYVKVLCSTNDGQMGLDLINKYSPDLVILDLILKTMDGLEILPEIKKQNPNCKVVVLTYLTGDENVSKATSLGADYYLIKPISSEMILKRISSFTEPTLSKSTLDDKISKIFISVGIPPHIKGYSFLREGVKMVVNNPSIINNITKQLYPMIGERFSTTPSKVERAIRHAIEVSWAKGRIDSINSLFGVSVYLGQEKPTNGEFIALIADKMLLEGI
ncbi:MAG: sporulation transcription factor Spo0A [Clostridia bacterium]|nr:sporulation transcription factor Spo0A [Clostridia bacterium]